MGNTVYLGLGSNVGEREKNIAAAVKLLAKNGVAVQKLSTIIETEPAGGPPQGKFLNAVLKAETDSPPQELLNKINSIEKQLGRVRTIKDAPRTIDIDILLYGRTTIKTPELTIPHPRMFDRDFVMKPLKEIEPHLENILPHENHPNH